MSEADRHTGICLVFDPEQANLLHTMEEVCQNSVLGETDDSHPQFADLMLTARSMLLSSKYFTGKLLLLGSSDETFLSRHFREELLKSEYASLPVCAVLICLSTELENFDVRMSSAKRLTRSLTAQFSPDCVLLLVVPNLSFICNEATKTDLLTWCARQQYEVIEQEEDVADDKDDKMHHIDGEEGDDDTDYLTANEYGSARIRAALHVAAASVTKQRRTSEVSTVSEVDEVSESPTLTGSSEPSTAAKEPTECVTSAVDDFEILFSRLGVMRDHCKSLDRHERKGYAEQVVNAFWNAIGGSDSEIKSSSDDGDDNSESEGEKEGTAAVSENQAEGNGYAVLEEN